VLNKTINIKAKVWRWPGSGGWHFVTLEKELSNKIRKIYPKGFVKINAILNNEKWDTSLFPHKQAGYLLCINKKIRKNQGIFEGDIVQIRINII
jgi:hypothetical protein